MSDDTRIERLQHAGMTFDVRDAGPIDGEVVVLLHGFPQDAGSWDAVAPRLAEAGLRTLAPDQRGYSPGASPRELSAYRTTHLVQDVLALIDATGRQRVHLVGHDWGGAVAWLTAQAAPERLASLTVLATPHPAAMGRALRRPEQLRKSWYIGAFQVPRLPEVVLSRRMRQVLTATGLPASLAERYARRFSTPESLTGPIGWYRATRLPGPSIADPDSPPVEVPTTYVWGSRDTALGRTAAEATGELVRAPYQFVELDASHWLPELEPDAVVQAVLERVYAV